MGANLLKSSPNFSLSKKSWGLPSGRANLRKPFTRILSTSHGFLQRFSGWIFSTNKLGFLHFFFAQICCVHFRHGYWHGFGLRLLARIFCTFFWGPKTTSNTVREFHNPESLKLFTLFWGLLGGWAWVEERGGDSGQPAYQGQNL